MPLGGVRHLKALLPVSPACGPLGEDGEQLGRGGGQVRRDENATVTHDGRRL